MATEYTPNPDFPKQLIGKKVLLATESLGPVNGVSRTTGMLVDYLRSNGVNVATCAPFYKGQPINANESKPQRQPINPEYRLQGYPLPYNPDLTVAYPFRLGVVYQKTFNPDIIYLASPASVGFQFLIQLRQIDNPPPTFLNFQTDLSAYAEILFPKPLDDYGVYLLSIVQGYLFRAPCVRTIFYPSAYVRKYMERTGAPSHKMRQLGRGVDTELFNPGRRDEAYRKEIAPNGEIIFACICRIAPEKGFEFLANAARKLKESGLAFKLLIVGGNKNPAVMQEVKNYFKGLEEQVIFTGMLRGEALAHQYAAADVFLHCSITETFGLVVLESMASGVPVIARDEGGPSETVKHGQSGFLTPPHDLDAFVSHARRLATGSALRSEMAENARVQALNTTWDKINNQVALELAAVFDEQPAKTAQEKKVAGFYGTWANMAGVYFAVGIVWVFWFIAVIPMLACGLVHGFLTKTKVVKK
ncbi:glycosyltransferase family 4 protein [Baudoinia panamericana UAMH 10762]|uniref:Glycosyltransferase family 4 protein n=1 Tax=Baudoinia panamericana (strain UAMH 10762) TaxID=717646 RepID=M2LRJ9_BAUPA|nr:glycosyltransferase family 4 protein [Baudoinia panamericana UAMH 10762]EMC97072.1 glycosyltransferase family 4 protein [Baudoinia panamericana UAMH 10762]